MRTLPTLPPVEQIAATLDWPFENWAHQCHAVSIAFVKQGIVPAGSRVARGSARGVGGQHSWIVVQTDGSGELADCYADDAVIIDPTLWSYVREVEGIWIGTADSSPYNHAPKGKGPHIFQCGRPSSYGEEPIPLDPAAYEKLDRVERHWVDEMFGPLDRRGWLDVLGGTMVGWPAGQILAAMDDTRELSPLIPVDLLGMLTDRNPGRLYLADGAA